MWRIDLSIMTARICDKKECGAKLDFIRIENHFGQFTKIMQCPKCEKLYSFLPDRIDQDIFNEGD